MDWAGPMVRTRFFGRSPTPLQWLLVAPMLLVLLASALICLAVLAAFALIATVLVGVVLILRPDLRRLILRFWRVGRHIRRSRRGNYGFPNEPISL